LFLKNNKFIGLPKEEKDGRLTAFASSKLLSPFSLQLFPFQTMANRWV